MRDRPLDFAWQIKPMRVFISAGLNDLVCGADSKDIVGKFIHLKEMLDVQNTYHLHTLNELVIAKLLNPPKLGWYPYDGPPPANQQGDQ